MLRFVKLFLTAVLCEIVDGIPNYCMVIQVIVVISMCILDVS